MSSSAAESVGLAQPFHDTSAALAVWPSIDRCRWLCCVGLANEFHDAAAVIAAGPPSLVITGEKVEVQLYEREASFVAGAPQVEVEAVAQGLADAFTDVLVSLTAGAPSFAARADILSPADRTGPLAKSISRGVATSKRLLLTGGLLRSIEWHRRTGEKDVRARQAVSVSLIDALISPQPALDRSTIDTGRADNTVLTFLDPVAITDSDLFRWGGHTYKISKIEGVVKNEVTGELFSSEVTVIR